MSTPKQKHPCPDCFFCQWCAEERCRACRGHDLPDDDLYTRSASANKEGHDDSCNCNRDNGCVGGSCEAQTRPGA